MTNFVAFLPTIITEEWRVYVFYILSNIFVILSLSTFSYGKLVSPIYVICMNGSLALIVILREKYLRKVNQENDLNIL
jgi:hypothetical protein